GHAVLAARRAVQRSFAVINADDFYGAGGYQALARHFRGSPQPALVAYPLRQTLSEYGTVSRGLCGIDAAGRLQEITELTKITKLAGGGASYIDGAGQAQPLTGNENVSMNFWGFSPAIFAQLDGLFREFLETQGADPKAEFYLPSALSELNRRGEARVALLQSQDSWFGITYREDLPTARSAMRELILVNRYPAALWG
ncbi:MAG: nucleotidyltransferase, partial [Candidatus Didemnitutus sp.]|nr:nucleotidyltransferase [Candidatus Didemnitutus sp.]